MIGLSDRISGNERMQAESSASHRLNFEIGNIVREKNAGIAAGLDDDQAEIVLERCWLSTKCETARPFQGADSVELTFVSGQDDTEVKEMSKIAYVLSIYLQKDGSPYSKANDERAGLDAGLGYSVFVGAEGPPKMVNTKAFKMFCPGITCENWESIAALRNATGEVHIHTLTEEDCAVLLETLTACEATLERDSIDA